MLTRRATLSLATAASLVAPEAALAQGAEQGGERFDAFVASVKAEARRAGISDATLAAAFAGVRPNQHIIDLDHHQAEFTLTWPQYRDRVLPASRLEAARENFARERGWLAKAEATFGVDSRIIMGIWGIESGFGANKGNYRLVEALSTLSWEGRRAAYFRKELLNGLRILDAGDVPVAKQTSGWAGAMGQPQFMPSSYLEYAVDFDGDGRRDIWDSKADVFGSVGNYLAKSGWRRGRAMGAAGSGATEPFARNGGPGQQAIPWRVDASGCAARGRYAIQHAHADGRPGAAGWGGAGEGYMVYANFNAIRRYNPSDFYALAVGLLGNAAA